MSLIKFDITNETGKAICDTVKEFSTSINMPETPKIPVANVSMTIFGFALMGTLLSACTGGAKASTYKAPDIAAQKAATIELFCSGSQVITDWEGREYQIPEKCGNVTFGNENIVMLPKEYVDKNVLGIAIDGIEQYDSKTGSISSTYIGVGLSPELSDCTAKIIVEKEYPMNAIAQIIVDNAGLLEGQIIKTEEEEGQPPFKMSTLMNLVTDAMAVDFMRDGLTPEDRECLASNGIPSNQFPSNYETSLYSFMEDGELSDTELCALVNAAVKSVGNAGYWLRDAVDSQELDRIEIAVCSK